MAKKYDATEWLHVMIKARTKQYPHSKTKQKQLRHAPALQTQQTVNHCTHALFLSRKKTPA
jgi:hypothetical protein